MNQTNQPFQLDSEKNSARWDDCRDITFGRASPDNEGLAVTLIIRKIIVTPCTSNVIALLFPYTSERKAQLKSTKNLETHANREESEDRT